MKSIAKRVVAVMLAAVMSVGVFSNVPADRVYASNDMTTAIEMELGGVVSGEFTEGEEGECYWYKFSIPEDVRNQNISISFMPATELAYRTLYLYDGGANLVHDEGGISSRNLSVNASIGKTSSDLSIPVLEKGKTYYIEILCTDGYNHYKGKYNISISGDTNKANSVSITASKGKKSVAVDTVAGAKVTVKIKNKSLGTITKTATANSSGIAKVKLSRKLTAGDKIVVTSKKSGYETKKKTKKIS